MRSRAAKMEGRGVERRGEEIIFTTAPRQVARRKKKILSPNSLILDTFALGLSYLQNDFENLHLRSCAISHPSYFRFTSSHDSSTPHRETLRG